MAGLKVIFQQAPSQQQHCGGGRERLNEMSRPAPLCWSIMRLIMKCICHRFVIVPVDAIGQTYNEPETQTIA